jgi:hypothetical protein
VTSSQQERPIDPKIFDLGPVDVCVATQAGPRIVGYSRKDGPQFFASVPDATVSHPDGGVFRFLGGHRLWRSPEVPASTYFPDDTPVEITATDDGFSVKGQADRDGIVKTISVSQRDAFTIVDHQFENLGARSVEAAPWAITQLVTGGMAILPEPIGPADVNGVLPTRRLVLWPYTDMVSPEVEFTFEGVVIHSTDNEVKTKLGMPNTRGWLAYMLDDELFVKWSRLHDGSERYADFGASAQCYRDERFIELETLGPLAVLAPGSSVGHREVWQLLQLGDRSLDQVLASLPSTPEGIRL